MRRHFLFAEDEKERSVGDGKANLLRLWHNRRNAMLEGDESADGGEANNALVGRELTLLWDLAKPLNSRTLQRDGYVEFFARAGKALVLPLSTDAIAILAARRDWEYDLEGVGSVNESTKAASSLDAEVMSAVQFREAVMQLAEIILPVESAPSVFAAFFRDLRNSVAELAASPSGREPEQDETNSTEPVDRFTLRPLNRIPKIANDAFLQKLPPSSEALRSIRGLQSPDQREMSLKQLLLCYNPRKFSLTRAFSKKKGSDTKVAEEAKTDTVDTPQPDVEDEMAVAKRLHLELMGSIGSGATPVRGRKLHRETAAHRNPEDALIAALTEFPALRIAVVGPPGCGKTRLARVLAQRLGLRYLSLDGVIQRAVDHKLRIRRRRPAVIIPVEGEDSAVETPLEMETVEADEEIDTDNAGEDESIDRVFRDEDLDALCAGGVVTRSKALNLFRLEATRSLLAGVGVIMDDVYPCELSISDNPGHSIAVDYLIALTALPTEIEHQLQGSQLAPAAGRLYSVRELATLKATHAEGLVAEGFADCLQPPKKPEVDAEEVQEPNGSTANGDAGASSEDQEVDESPSPEENDEEGDGGQVLSEEPVLPPEPTPAERNEIEPPGERTLPFGSIAMAKFTKGYHEYVTRMQRELLTRRVADSTEKRSDCHLVVALSTQSLNVIRDHCIQTITGTPLGLSRFSTSREACQVSLPENLNGSSRAEKVRWLLYGDWAALLEAEASSTTESFARLPRRDAKRRLLSKWREFCPVVSTSVGALTLGDPEFAACYSGRVYLLASQEARRAFCAYPLQFLLREIPIPSKCRNFWLVTTGAGDAFTPSYLEALEAGLHVQTVSTSKLLKTSPSIAMEMRLMSGQIVSPVEAAAIASDAAKTLLAKQNASSGWMLMDLPLTRDVAAALLEHGCVPDAILLLDREVAAVQEDGEGSSAANMSALSALRRQQFQTEKAGAEDVSQGIGGVTRVITCPLFRQPSDTLAAIERELNPIAPRLDRIEDGHAPELVDEYDPTVIFASPLPENDEVNEGKSTSTSEEGDEVDVTDPEAEAQAKAARSRALQLQGECGHFCPVTWHTRGLLIPGLPTNVCLFRQKFYAFAGEQERLAFERNPATFIPNGPRSTTNFVPCVLVLGVRGSGRGRVTAALAKSQSDSLVEYLNLDLTVVANRAERRRLLEELKPEEARMTSEEMFVESLQLELKRQEPTPKKAVARIIAGLGSEPSRIPTTAMLEMCFKHGLFPALVVPLTVSEDDVVNTLLDRWAASLPTPRRKLALMRKKEAGADGEDDTVPEDEAEEEEPPIDLEEAREEESTRLHEQFTEDQKALDEAIAGLRARGVRTCNPIDASGASRQIIKNVRRLLNDFMAGRETLLEHCEVIDMAAGGTMQRLLASGELLVGKHGASCPVTGRTDSLSVASVKAVVHRNQLYFPRSREARRAFVACPSRYLDKPSLPPMHQLTCCVAGAPFSGKTRVSQELANALGLVYVSPQNAIEWVMQCQGGSALRHRLQEITNLQHDPLNDASVTHEVICARLRSSECQTRGWVLDGYLLQRHELQRSLPHPDSTEASSQCIQPDMLFVLECSFQSVWKNHQTHVDRNELRVAFTQWHQHRLELLGVWTRSYGCFHVRQLDSSSNSLWNVAAQAQVFLEEQQQLASHHTRAMASGRAARSLGVVRTDEELQGRQHNIFQTFCPVELQAGKFYNSRQSSRDLCVDFRGCSFWLGSEQNLEQFVDNPEGFVGYLPEQTPLERGEESWPTQEDAESEAQTLVAKAPVNASLVSLLTVPDCDFPEMKGYCPVTFALGSGDKDWASLRHGSVFFRASYRSKVYFFVSEEARRKFCAEPSRYASQSLPVKLPPQVALAKSYPGQLEQKLGAALNEVLLALGCERPKFPQMPMRASACVYLALSLKALQRKYQLKVKPDPRSARDEDEPDEEQKQRQERREEQAERDATARRDAFVRDCRLGEQLKVASTPTHTSCGSGAKVARSMRAAHDSLAGNETESYISPAPANEEVDQLRHRFDAIVSGSSSADKTLSTDPRSARTHARAAFLEYIKPSTAI